MVLLEDKETIESIFLHPHQKKQLQIHDNKYDKKHKYVRAWS